MKINKRRDEAYASIGRLFRLMDWYQGVLVFGIFLFGVSIGCLVSA